MPHKDPAVAAAYHAAYEARRRGTRATYMAEWRAAHAEEVRALGRARHESGVDRPYHAAYRAIHREERAAHQRAYATRLRAEDDAAFRASARAGSARYRERAADSSVTWIDLASAECGVCGSPLVPAAKWPDPMATTVGHEPPLSRIAGFSEGVRRPEHWGCNLAKSARLDAEMEVSA